MPEKRTNNKQPLSKYAVPLVIVVLLCVIAVILIIASASKATPSGDGTTNDTAESSENTQKPNSNINTDNGLDPSLTYYANIDIKEYGTTTIKLDQNAAPITVTNFVKLANSGFYNGLTFHRIMKGFMMQGGSPNGSSNGGSGSQIFGEFANNGFKNPLSHTRGAISMARNSINNNSASSQFFIVHQDSQFLDGDYAVFGYVTEGMDVVDAVCEAAKPTDGNGTIPAEIQPIISTITIWTE